MLLFTIKEPHQTVAGLPVLPVRIVGMALAALGTWLVIRWRTEARENVERYSRTSDVS